MEAVVFDELTTMTSHFVLAFVKSNDQFRLDALLGPGMKAYVHPHDAQWLGGYLPAGFRAGPFELGATTENPTEPILCIDPDALVPGDTPDTHRLFADDDNVPTLSF